MPVHRMMALRRHFWTKIGGLALMALAFSGAEARAQIINQNDYIPLPPGTNIALGYYQFSQYGDVNIIGKGTESKSNLVANIMVSRYVHYFKLGHFTAAVQALLPFGAQSNANVGGEPLQPTFGAGDLSLGAAFWPLNDPVHHRYLAIGGYIIPPAGSYEPDQVLSMGDHRWSTVAQIGSNWGIGQRFSLDAVADATFYGDNGDFYGYGAFPVATTLHQQNSYRVQFFLNYIVNRAATVSVGFLGQSGGVQSYDGFALPGVGVQVPGGLTGMKTEQNMLRVDGSMFLAPTWQVLGEVNHDFNAVGGFKDEIGFELRVLKIF